MNITDLIAIITVIVLIPQNATQILAAVAELLRACLPVVHATRDLIAAITHPSQAATTCQEDADVDPSSAPAPPRDSAEPPASE